MALLHIDDAPAAPARGALLALGFRPFYLLAAALAAVSVPAWLASYLGPAALPRLTMFWHMHEMVFGFAIAVVIGFLYTAARNWTGLWTPRGAALGALALLWVAGRVAMLAAPPVLAAVIDLAFLPLAAWPLHRVIARADSRRNRFLVGLLALLTLCNLAYHLSILGVLPVSPLHAIHAAIILIVAIESAIGGRVIPNFTASAVPGAKPVQSVPLDRAALALTCVAGLAWALGAPALLTAPLAMAAACAQMWRLAGWKPWCTLGKPLLWILHVSYAWIPVGFAMLALAQLGLVPVSAAVHVLGVGALGGLIVGMITRTALGHTGRPLAAGGAETTMYVLVQLGVLTRLCAALAPSLQRPLLIGAAVCWSACFLLYLAVYGPRLCAARIDGREG